MYNSLKIFIFSFTVIFSQLSFSLNLSLEEKYKRILGEAETLAGRPGDIAQRVVFLHSIYNDSEGNHTFPQVALHGALWARGFFDRTGSIGKKISYRYFYDRQERERRLQMLENFFEGFQAVNRQVFVDTYTNYYFSKRHGLENGADKYVPAPLLKLLNELHQRVENKEFLTEKEKRDLFETALLYEQETSVGPEVERLVREEFDCPILKRLALKPIVRFAYFPRTKFFLFRNFANKQERIVRAMDSHRLAERAGWGRVVETMEDYGILPGSFFDNKSVYTEELKSQILNEAGNNWSF